MISFWKYGKMVLICIACLALCSFAFVNVVDAAVGNSTSHGSSSSGSKSGSSSSSKSGSSSKSSGSSSHDSSSYDSSSSSNGSSASSNSTSSSSNSSTGSGSDYTGSAAATGTTSRADTMGDLLLIALIGTPIAVVVVIIIALVIIFKKKKKNGSVPGDLDAHTEVAKTGVVKDPAYLRQAIAELRERDPEFSEDLFISRINNMFIQLQEAWQAKDWKRVRPFESDELFNQHARQLQELIDSHTTNVVDEIAILRTEISDYHDNGATETLDVYMRCRYKDYIVDDNTGKVVEGDPDREYFMEYELAMSRKKGVTTRLAQNTVVSTCPNCGANVSINASGECEYCNSVVSNGDFDWVLTRMDVLSQN